MSEAVEKATRRQLRRVAGQEAIQVIDAHQQRFNRTDAMIGELMKADLGHQRVTQELMTRLQAEHELVTALAERVRDFETQGFMGRCQWVMRGLR